jgi:hypothetical protein
MLDAKEDDRKHKLNIEELKKHKGLENLENTDAEIVINSLYHLSLLFYECYQLNMNEE